MEDLGPPVSHLALPEGVPVYDADGREIGIVDKVVLDEVTGIFEGLTIHTRPVVPGRHLFAAHDQVDELHENGVRLAVRRDELDDLDATPASRRRGGDRRPGARGAERPVEAALRKAWDWLAGVR
jgi:sporulation protein YlmC with PRC-barrel domain